MHGWKFGRTLSIIVENSFNKHSKTVNQANIDVGMTSIDQWIIHCWFVLPNDARGQIIVKTLKINKNRNNWEKLLQSFYYQ